MYNLLLTFIKCGNDTRCLRLSCGFIIIHVALPRPLSFLVWWVSQWFVVDTDPVSALLSGWSVSSESVNQYFHLGCAWVTAFGYFNDTQLLNYTHSAIPRSLDAPPLYCWPVQKHVGEACKTLQGNPIIIQAALAFCWVLHAQNLNVTLNSAALITCAVGSKFWNGPHWPLDCQVAALWGR